MSEDANAQARDLSGLEDVLGHHFADRVLLETALQHASYSNETPGGESNERLEFLGDAVIALVVADLLFEAYPSWREGDLTRALHQLVDRQALADLARRLRVGEHLRLGRTERQSAGEQKDSILADTMEAILGALYLDAGLPAVVRFAREVFGRALRAGRPRVGADPKTEFQEAIMARHGEFPSYDLLSDSGLEGDPERFSVAAVVRGERWATGVGRTKRRAERLAAERSLERIAAEGEASLDAADAVIASERHE